MARISDDEIQRLKDEISIQRLAEAKGVTLKKHGSDLIGHCPFHDDKTPSLVITPKKNLWHCLGACQTGGSVIDWVMKAEGISFRHAVELLRADFLPLAANESKPVKQSTVPKLPTRFEATMEDQAMLGRVVDYYHRVLKQSPEALAYLEKRGIGNAEAIERFKLGYADRTLGYRLPQKNRKEGAAIRGQLQRLGILRTTGHEHFAGSLVIPILGDNGEVRQAYGRKLLDKRLRKGTAQHLYLPGPHAGVWNLEAVKADREIILCESLIDALTFWCAGYRNVTASYGIEGFTDYHLAAFKKYGTQRVLIAYDRDAAGEAAAEKLAKKLMAQGIDAYRIQFPKSMDANEYALQVQPATKSLGVVIRSALWLGKGKGKTPTTQASTEPESLSSLAAQPPESEPAPEPESEAAKEEAVEPLPAKVIPDAPAPDIEADVKPLGEAEEIRLAFGDRRYRIRGLHKNQSFEQLRINLLVSAPAFDGPGGAIHVDTLDMYAARSRDGFIRQAAVELGVKEAVIKRDLGQVLLKLEALQERRLNEALKPKTPDITLDADERNAALDLLTAPNLLDRILADFECCGVVGEENNKLVGYLAAVSRKLDQPLAVIIQSTSAAGKSSLMNAVLSLMPPEQRVQYSAMTGQSLFYMGESDLKHKILAIVEEEGAERAAYALKLLQSEGELTIASTGKDPATGQLLTQEYHVEGPVMIFLTTTAIEIDEELLNRCLVLSVDEGREQTEAIHQLQRTKRTLSGLMQKTEREAILALHRNAQRLLRPLAVVNPYAEKLTFLSDQTRTRRDHEKYLTLIDVIALLHQYQRQIKTLSGTDKPVPYVEVELADIAAANRLAHEVLGRTLDELPPQTRKLLTLIRNWVRDTAKDQAMEPRDLRFSRRDIRAATGWGDTQLKIHLARLVDMEYLLVHQGGRGQSFVYELLYDGSDGHQPHLNGLLDVETLENSDSDANRSGVTAKQSGSGRASDGDQSAGGRSAKTGATAWQQSDLLSETAQAGENALLPETGHGASYPPSLAARA